MGGTRDNSLFAQVFVYNNWNRIGVHLGAGTIVHKLALFLHKALLAKPEVPTIQRGPSLGMLFMGPLGRDGGWLLPASLVLLVVILAVSRRPWLGDERRGAALLWGTWLLAFGASFSSAHTINSYYLVALMPAVGALLGVRLVTLSEHIARGVVRRILAALLAESTVYAVVLVSASGALRWWLVGISVFLGAGAVLVVALARSTRARRATIVVVSSASLLAVPAATTGLVVAEGLGAFSTPYQSAAVTRITTTLPVSAATRRSVAP